MAAAIQNTEVWGAAYMGPRSKVKFQDQIFSKFPDNFDGFREAYDTENAYSSVRTNQSYRSIHGTMNCHNQTQYWTLNDSSKHVVMVCKKY